MSRNEPFDNDGRAADIRPPITGPILVVDRDKDSGESSHSEMEDEFDVEAINVAANTRPLQHGSESTAASRVRGGSLRSSRSGSSSLRDIFGSSLRSSGNNNSLRNSSRTLVRRQELPGSLENRDSSNSNSRDGNNTNRGSGGAFNDNRRVVEQYVQVVRSNTEAGSRRPGVLRSFTSSRRLLMGDNRDSQRTIETKKTKTKREDGDEKGVDGNNMEGNDSESSFSDDEPQRSVAPSTVQAKSAGEPVQLRLVSNVSTHNQWIGAISFCVALRRCSLSSFARLNNSSMANCDSFLFTTAVNLP